MSEVRSLKTIGQYLGRSYVLMKMHVDELPVYTLNDKRGTIYSDTKRLDKYMIDQFRKGKRDCRELIVDPDAPDPRTGQTLSIWVNMECYT